MAEGGRSNRDRLLDVGLQLMREHGADAVSLREVARLSGATPPMINYYFSSKWGFFHALFDHVMEPLHDLLRQAAGSGGDPAQAVAQIVRCYMKVVRDNPWMPPLLLPNGRLRPPIRRRGPTRMVELARLIEAGQRAGQFRADITPEFAATHISSSCIFPSLAVHELSDEVFAAFVEETVWFLLGGFGFSPSANPSPALAEAPSQVQGEGR